MARFPSYLRPAAAFAVAAAVLVGVQLVPAAAEPREDTRVSIEHFMAGLACVESSGRYDAVNPQSGAYGKYQIMPRNWPVWARRFLGDASARPTPDNQEIVARGRIEQLHATRETWRRVAYWWLTGRSDANEARWTPKALGYVESVMRWARRAASPAHADRVPERCFPRPVEAPRVNARERAPDGRGTVVVTGRSLHVRAGPGAENRPLAIVRRGDVLEVVGRGRDARGKRWLEVALGDTSGWVAGWYTEPKSDG